MREEQLKNQLLELEQLLAKSTNPQDLSVVVGFDGFVDEIIHVVNKRESFDSFQRLETISEFGARIQRAAGLSTNIELVPTTVKLGGNGPIMGNALVAAGIGVSYVGAIGDSQVHPVFQEFADGCQQVISIAEPGHTDALEFTDGKVMLGKIQSLNDVNWENLLSQLGEAGIRDLFTGVQLVATVNWTMTPYMNQIWENLLALLPAESPVAERPLFFVDLADPEKRKNQDIAEALRLIQKFNRYYRVVLGLNRKEASEIATVLNLSLTREPQNVDLAEITQAISKALDIWCLLVHPTHEAAAVCQGELAYTTGPYTSSPRLTTGAGDNFNAGVCLGLLLGLPLQKALMLGTATSGFYVRNMHSPSFAQLRQFVQLWAEQVGKDF